MTSIVRWRERSTFAEVVATHASFRYDRRVSSDRGPDSEPSQDSASGAERRECERFDFEVQVDIESEETFLFAYITNISEMGIFVQSENPLPVGTELHLRFCPRGGEPFELDGMVVWINPIRIAGDNLNPGMGVRFERLAATQRERVVALVRTVAYLQDDSGGD